jgi:small-conductance mechanosensitive channel
MIESGFAAQGIAIPYAQRDVHLDASSPLPVRLVPEPEPAANTVPSARPLA